MFESGCWMVEQRLTQSAKNLQLGRRFVFQQDNEPEHKAKATQERLQNNDANVRKTSVFFFVCN